MIAEGTKVCPAGKHGCGKALPVSQFYKARDRAGGLGTYCKSCVRKLARARRIADPSLKSVQHRCTKYGLSSAEVVACMEIPLCQACGIRFDTRHSQKFDHCHDMMHFRGVLCHACNMACMGASKEAAIRLRKCIAYLKRDIEREQARAH